MKRLIYKLFFLSVLFIGLTACDDQDETEYWLPGTWAGTVGNRDASFQFNENRTGSFRIEGGDSGTFIILDFGRGDKACITGSYADRKSISGWYYSFYEDYLDGYDDEARALVLRRVGY